MMKDCNSGHNIPINVSSSEVFQSMKIFWISYTSEDEHFWNHEYNKHGYCYTERYNKYDPKWFFEYSMELYNKHGFVSLLSSYISHAFEYENSGNELIEKHFSFDELRKVISTSLPNFYFDLACEFQEEKQLLKEIRFYFNLELSPVDNKHTSCNCDHNREIVVLFK
jgi:hypothetical protein